MNLAANGHESVSIQSLKVGIIAYWIFLGHIRFYDRRVLQQILAAL